VKHGAKVLDRIDRESRRVNDVLHKASRKIVDRAKELREEGLKADNSVWRPEERLFRCEDCGLECSRNLNGAVDVGNRLLGYMLNVGVA